MSRKKKKLKGLKFRIGDYVRRRRDKDYLGVIEGIEDNLYVVYWLNSSDKKLWFEDELEFFERG